MQEILDIFRLTGKTAVITGGGGILGSTIARGLGLAGARIAICDIREDMANKAAEELIREGITARGFALDVLKRESLEKCCESVIGEFERVDILISAAGGNQKGATTSADQSFFDLSEEAMRMVVDLNLFGGAVFPAQIFGREMVKNPDGGSIINLSSMAAIRPLTRTAGYSAAKAAVSNFTMWLAVHMAQEYSPKVRVNALAPGFFLTEQNRYLLLDEGGNPTPRGKQIIDHTPANRYGDPKDLVGAALWLASDASEFVTGIVLPVDGGFAAYCGV